MSNRENSELLARLPKSKLLQLIAEEKRLRGNEAKGMIRIICNALAIKEGIIEREFGKEVSDMFGRKCRRPSDCPAHDNFNDESDP